MVLCDCECHVEDPAWGDLRQDRPNARRPIALAIVDLAAISDSELLAELHDAQRAIPGISDPEGRRAAWDRVFQAHKELERRYPSAFQPI